MVAAGEILFEFGTIMLIAFIGAALATRFKQSVILGYMLAGILIGPFIHISIWGWDYNGLFTNEGLIGGLSQMGLILLLFFVGLEFSVSKLRRTKTPATLLAIMNLGINMFAGILLGTALGWPLMDTIFLAGVVAMSSCAITAKALIDLNRLENPETEFLLGMVIVEDFLSMLLLTIVGGLMIKGGAVVDLPTMAIGIIGFYLFFIVLAVWVIPRVVNHLNRIRNEEMFVLFALGVVFLSAALAEMSFVPGIIGAFFIGMVFAESKITERFEKKLMPFKDAFVAIFFVTFGMMIDLSRIPDVIAIVAIAVPLVIINDVFITAALAYFMGFSSKGSVSMGTSLCGRGAESVMYASVGSNAVGATKGAELYPFAGVFCFVMSVITPVLMRSSDRLAIALRNRLPLSLRCSGAIISRTLGKMVMPQSLRLYRSDRWTTAFLVLYMVGLIVMAVFSGPARFVALGAGLIVALLAHRLVNHRLVPIVQHTNYTNIGVMPRDRQSIRRLISRMIGMGLVAILFTTFVYIYWWGLSVVVMSVFLVSLALLMRDTFRRTLGGRPGVGATPMTGFAMARGDHSGWVSTRGDGAPRASIDLDERRH